MTTESQKAFEKWLNSDIRHNYFNAPACNLAWKGSEQRIKDKLLSEEMVGVVARSICENYYGIIADAEVSQHPTKLAWENYSGEAKAALQAIVEAI